MDLTLNAQAAVIGSLLLAPEKLSGEIFRRVQPEDFRDTPMRSLFSAAREIWLEKKPLDAVTLRDRAGDAYGEMIAEILRLTPTAANWESYCDIVRSDARLADLRDLAYQVIEAGTADAAQDLLLKAQGMLAQRESVRVTSYQDMMQDFFDRMADETPADFLDWGFEALNRHVHITQGRFVVLAAESSVGKTALALQMARGLAKGGKRVGFFSLETSAPDAADRIMANAGDVSLTAIKRKTLTAPVLARMADDAQAMSGVVLDLIESAGCTVDDIRALTLSRRYDVVFVDYVQLIRAKGDEPSDQVRAVSMALHTLAIQLGVTVVGLSQVTPPPKNQKGQRPELSKDNLRESRQLIHDAEAILILDLADLTDYGSNRILKVDKNKDGPCCRLILSFDAARMRFEYVPPPEDESVARARERVEVMDRHRLERMAKAAAVDRVAIDGQVGFTELADDGEEVPF